MLEKAYSSVSINRSVLHIEHRSVLLNIGRMNLEKFLFSVPYYQIQTCMLDRKPLKNYRCNDPIKHMGLKNFLNAPVKRAV